MIRRNVWSEVDITGECFVLEGSYVVIIDMVALCGRWREWERCTVNPQNTIAYSEHRLPALLYHSQVS